jgi:excisionase family DNA binding protein
MARRYTRPPPSYPPEAPKSTGEAWFSVPDACRPLGIVNHTPYRFIDEGQVSAYKCGRVIRLRRTDVVAFPGRQRIEPGTLGHLRNPVTAVADRGRFLELLLRAPAAT